jgi:peptide/nickel transport system substrate-binding protein
VNPLARRALRALVAAGFVALLAGCAASGATRDRSTLVVLEAGDANSVNPLLSNQYYAFNYQSLIFDFLVGTGKDYRPIPALATSWTPIDGGKSWIVKLRHGVRWSDGQPFTARDVVFTMNALLDPKTGSPYQGQTAYVKRVVALDPYTVRFDLDGINATFMANVLQSEWIVPEHVLGRIPHAQIRTSGFGEHPIGTGRYKLVRWNHDQEMLLEANPLWWGGPIAVKRIDFRIVSNNQTRYDAMLQGTADVDDAIGPTDYERFGKLKGMERMNVPDLFVRYIQINLRTPGLDDVSVRQAMMYGWDRTAFANGLMRGAGTVASSIWPTGNAYWHDSRIKPYPYDRAKATALLDAAGWRPGPDGIRRKGSHRLAFSLSLPNGEVAPDIAADFQADMRAIGIAITVHMVDYATFIEETNESKYQLAYTGWGGDPDPDQETLLDSHQFPPNGNNTGFYHNPAVDRDLEAAVRVIDPVKRKAYYDDVQVRTAHDVPVLFTTNEFFRIAYRARVHPVGPLLPDTNFWNDVQSWRLDP